MKILITGGAGFIGKAIVGKLPISDEIIIIDSLDEQIHKNKDTFPDELLLRARCIKSDIQNIKEFKAELENLDAVIHLASQTGTGQSMYEMSKYVTQNVTGTARLAECLTQLKNPPKKILLTSSRAVYGEGAYQKGNTIVYPPSRTIESLSKGMWDIENECGEKLMSIPMNENHITNPTTIYGLTKLWQEQLLQNVCLSKSVPLSIVRLQNVYGPGQELSNPYTGIIGIFSNRILKREKVELFEDGLMTRDFVFIDDVVNGILQLIAMAPSKNVTLNIGTGIATRLLKVTELIAKILNETSDVFISGRFRVGDIRHAVADMKMYKEKFVNWEPTFLEVGLKKYLDWFLAQEQPETDLVTKSLKEMENKGLFLTSEMAKG